LHRDSEKKERGALRYGASSMASIYSPARAGQFSRLKTLTA
jgi:hypothetical protein